MASIVTLTMNPAVDVSVGVDRVVPDAKLRCGRPRRDPGGGGVNVARVVRELGSEALALYTAGGWAGGLLRSLLDGAGLRHEPIDVRGATRENVTVVETGSGRQYRFVMPGPELAPEEWRRCLDRVAALDPPPEYLVASGSLPPGVPDDFYVEVGERLAGRGTRYVLDSSGTALAKAARAGVFLLKPNLRELGQLAGRDVAEEPEQERAARDLVDEGRAEVVVVSMGAGGALLVTRDGSERIAAPTVPIQSRVGAGDSTVAGIVLGLARGEDVATAVRYGIAAGAAAVMTPGTELCRRTDVERLFRRMQDEGRRAGPGRTAAPHGEAGRREEGARA